MLADCMIKPPGAYYSAARKCEVDMFYKDINVNIGPNTTIRAKTVQYDDLDEVRVVYSDDEILKIINRHERIQEHVKIRTAVK
jgi:hypothetical protein